MHGISDHEYLALRFQAFADEVLAPAVHAHEEPLEVAVFQPAQRLTPREAAEGTYENVVLGHRWGPAWSTAWFRLRGRVPEAAAGRSLCLRFATGTEALLWWQGEPLQGFDPHREACPLPALPPGTALELLVEAACNLPLGATTFWWDAPELRQRWQERTPGRLDAASLVFLDEGLWWFLQKYRLAVELAVALPADSPRAADLLRGLARITARLPAEELRAGREGAAAELDALLEEAAAPAATRCFLTGHCHIDTAWLWPLAETRRKVLRSFSNALGLMERFPGFRFAASPPQHLAFLEEDSPGLFARVRARIQDGRFEPVGPMWVEPDCNLPSGESLIRQIQHGLAYLEERFGAGSRQRLLVLLDTFGFPASLPQILKLSGIDTFVTTKLAWNECNEFPHVTFRWRGIDGSEVLCHCPPANDYNSPLAAADLLRGQENLRRKDRDGVEPRHAAPALWLHPYGPGDGGGGPTAEMAARAALGATTSGLPALEQRGMLEFCEALHRARDEERRCSGADVALWDGELYLELHRGTYTSVAWIKEANARAERRLRAAEVLLVLAGDAALLERGTRELEAVWKHVLLHQFHDVLPGTAITAVYEEARRSFAAAEERLQAVLDEALAVLRARADTRGMRRPVLVFNPCSHARSERVGLGDTVAPANSSPAVGNSFAVRDLAPLEARVVEAAASGPLPESLHARAEERRLENAFLRVVLDAAGRIARLEDAATGRVLNAVAADGSFLPQNQLVAYEDRPRRWEAWDIDLDHEDQATPLEDPVSFEVLDPGPVRAVVQVSRCFRRSTIRQRYVLRGEAARLDVETEVDWQESRTLLRVLNPVNVRARHATFGIQFGCIERPTHRNTSHERFQFEVCGHRWMDLSQGGLGLALLDGGKYGRSCRDGVLGLSLLRSPEFPAPGIDRGRHRFTYAFFPHDGDWRRARVPRQADEVNEPLWVEELPAEQEGSARSFALFDLAVEGGDVEISCLKRAAADGRWILRLGERHGALTQATLRWHAAVGAVERVDCREQLLAAPVHHDRAARRTQLALAPFELATLRIEPPPPA